jgi:hypothetical protein
MSLTLLQRWENTIAQSLRTHLFSPVMSNTNDDPLVKAAQHSLESLGRNSVELLTQHTPTTSDPLVAASFKPMNGLLSAQQQLETTYGRSNLYSNTRPTNTLLFTDGPAPKSLIPQEGRIDSPEFHGGNLYHPGNGPMSTYAPIASHMPGTMFNSMDIFALAQWARNIGMEFGAIQRPGDTTGQRMKGIAKGISFLATQFLLSTFNPADPQNGGKLNMLYSPLHLPAAFIPGLQGNALSSPNVPAVLSLDGKVYSTTQNLLPPEADRHLLMRQGLYQKQTNASDILHLKLNHPGFIGDIAKPGPQDTLGALRIPGVNGVPIAAQVNQDGLLGAAAVKGPYMVNLYTQNTPYSLGPAVDNDWIEERMHDNPDDDPQQIILRALFKSYGAIVPGVNPAISSRKTDQYFWYSERKSNQVSAKRSSYPTDMDAQFHGEGSDGLIEEQNAISDADNYMPFTFQDLRDSTPSLLYFRAFLKDGITETFQPNWQSEGFYGRVDEVPTYVNTMRTIQVAFDVVAWSPKDLPVIWTKLTKLQSMVYPTFDTQRFLQAGPLVRMRIGDLFAVRKDKSNIKKGMPGYIQSLTFSYDDNIWNVRTDYKIPRKVSVSLGFVVVHDGNPGVYMDNAAQVFGTLEFRDDSPTPIVLPGGIRGILDTIANKPELPNDSITITQGSVLT